MKGSRPTPAPLLLRLGLGLTAAVTLTACGVPPSDVIEAGEPASGMFSPSSQPPTPATVSLYFLDDGTLTTYPRRTDDATDLQAVVRLLFEGPTATEAATATTQLPHLTDAPRLTTGDDGMLSIRLPGEAAPLSRLAMRQLACTVNQSASPLIAAAPNTDTEATGGAGRPSAVLSSLRILGDGWTMTQSDAECPAISQPQELPQQ
ncbi:GerMN domain-containing protein [Streptomyces sp. NPDC056486]|uniref:GerMN domain-containing protein n=1 Tax=Streptomyces sp. NPDC056486 TaxID=3345835 RepID=UPI0036CCFB77